MPSESKIRITIVYPADPLGSIQGGIDSFIRGVIRWAPDSFEFSIVGVTTDQSRRPVGRWSDCDLAERKFRFFPLFAINNPERQPRIPATLTYMLKAAYRWPSHHYDLLHFHRIEPVIQFLGSDTAKMVFIHQNMEVLRDKQTDIRWKSLPALYFRLEDWLIPQFESVYTVHEQAAKSYRARYADAAGRIHFLPTWTDPNMFRPPAPALREGIRGEFRARHGIGIEAKVAVFVGRLDLQKDPLRLIDAFAIASAQEPDAHLLMIGDGVLRTRIEKRIRDRGIGTRVTLLGRVPNQELVGLLQGCDLMVLSSAYEGMPICLLEGLACGLPVATTDVGEVRRLVRPGVNGNIADGTSAEDLASAVVDCFRNIESYRGERCLEVAQHYAPTRVLQPVYEESRRLARIEK
jgi:glycosyltransferase involved in cell wall biosynthesis